MGEGGVKNQEKLPTLFIDGPLELKLLGVCQINMLETKIIWLKFLRIGL